MTYVEILSNISQIIRSVIKWGFEILSLNHPLIAIPGYLSLIAGGIHIFKRHKTI